MAYLHIDTSDLDELLINMRQILTEDEARRLLVRVFAPNRVGSKVKTILSTTLPLEYHAKKGFIKKAIGSPKLHDGQTISVEIPLDGARGILGDTFAATGSDGGKTVRTNWTGRKGQKKGKNRRRQRKVTITASIVKSGPSTLPPTIPHQGNNPPFIAFGKGGAVYTRTTKARYPIARVPGLALPQMPMNRSEPAVQAEIKGYMKERIIHEFKQLLGKFG